MRQPTNDLIVAFAAPPDTSTRAQLSEALSAWADDPKNPLPHLRQALMHRVALPLQTESDGGFSFAMPHETALALALKWTNAAAGLLPLAAWEAQQQGLPVDDTAWAWVTPCHWAVGTQQVVLETPAQLGLTADESLRLLTAVKPLFEEDGIRLHFTSPHRWLAEGAVFRGVRTAAIERAAGRDVAIWLPEGQSGKPLRRLQSELQMWLYQHPDIEAMNEGRQAKSQHSVNSFWFSGAGALPAPHANATTHTPVTAPLLQLQLSEAALSNDVQAWARGWISLDKALGQGLLADTASITLCGERAQRTWLPQSKATPAKMAHWRDRMKPLFRTLKARLTGSTTDASWQNATQDL